MGVLDSFRLDGKTALVTGGGQGIGQGYAHALAEAGASVAIVDINPTTAQEVAEALVRAYGMAKEGLGKIGQKLQTTKTVVLAVGPDARRTVKNAFKASYDEDLGISFSARDLGVEESKSLRTESAK